MSQVFFLHQWRVDPSLRTVSGARGEVLHIEPKQMQVLLLLAEHRGQVVSKEKLLHTVWANTFVGDEVLSRAISELRRVLEDDPKAPRFIQTIPKAGYRLVAPVVPELPVVMPARGAGALNAGRAAAVLAALVVSAGAYAVWTVMKTGGARRTAATAPALLRPLTTLPGREGGPSFSPDGTRVAFHHALGSESRVLVQVIGDDPPQEITSGASDEWPAWSPDGRLIAFSRRAGAESGVYCVPSIGGPVRRVYTADVYGGPRWSPDGRFLYFSAPFAGPSRVHRLSLETMKADPLTTSDGWDQTPAVSPDGKSLAVVHLEGAYSEDLYLVPTAGGVPRRLTNDRSRFDDGLAWTPDGTAILFSSARSGLPAIWKLSIGTGHLERLPFGDSAAGGVALDATGRRIAYAQGRPYPNMRMKAFRLDGGDAEPIAIAESSRSEHSPSFSPDGRRLVFSSDRAADEFDIWTANADGTEPVRLTSIEHGMDGSPRWSPEGEQIAFDRSNDIFVVHSAGGSPRRLTTEASNDFGPHWSRDGRFVYFGSDRSGRDEVWKVAAEGGEAIRVTKEGGYGGAESGDGFLYYSKGNGKGGVWRMPVQGGREEPVILDQPRGAHERYWELFDDGIYYLNEAIPTRPVVEFLDLATRKVRQVLALPAVPVQDWSPSLAVSPDRRTLITTFTSPAEADIMLVEYPQ